jgi:UDP-3-O-[3-hydroxymyristoyl] glucosamine N-acyltransferase
VGHPAPSRPLTTGDIAALVKGDLQGPADLAITCAESIDAAGPGAITFIRSAAFAPRWAACRASAAIVSRGADIPGSDPARAVIVVTDADAAMSLILQRLAPAPITPNRGVHASSVIGPAARVDPSASIGPLCHIGPGATVGAGASLLGSVTIGPGASVGDRSVLHPGVVIGERCEVGRDCLFHAGVVIGADGFGFAPDTAVGGRGVVKVPHIGNVKVGDHVEIGANTCIDRAKFGSTTIGDGTKIDNLVQIAHNCRIGRSCLICGQSGLSGTVSLGDGVILAGSVVIADNISIGAGARVGGRSSVNNNIPPGETWLGTPAQPIREAGMNMAVYRDLARHIRELRKLQRAQAGP